MDTVPKAVTIGNSKLIADQRANSIIVLGNREVVMKVEKILDEMDVKAPQVSLSTVIGQLTLSNNEEFGVDWFAKYNRRFVGTSRNNSVFTTNDPNVPIPGSSVNPGSSVAPVVPNILDPANLINFSQIIQNVGNGTNIYVAAGNAFAAIVHLLESTNRFRVISRPTVFTSNNKKAIIASGQEVPVPVSTLTNSNVGGVVNNTAAVSASIEYKKVVLQLEVVPLINSEKEVSLDILQKIDSIVPGGNVNISGNSVPTIDTRYIRTNVSAGNGSTIILGGLIEDQKQKNYQGLSLSLAHSPPWRGVPFHSEWQAASRTNHSHVSRGDLDEAGSLSTAAEMGEQQHTFWSGTGSGWVSGLPQSGDGQTDKLTAAGSSRG